jgi:hypothetical protein
LRASKWPPVNTIQRWNPTSTSNGDLVCRFLLFLISTCVYVRTYVRVCYFVSLSLAVGCCCVRVFLLPRRL